MNSEQKELAWKGLAEYYPSNVDDVNYALLKYGFAIQPIYKPPFTEIVYANGKGETVHTGDWIDSNGQKLMRVKV